MQDRFLIESELDYESRLTNQSSTKIPIAKIKVVPKMIPKLYIVRSACPVYM